MMDPTKGFITRANKQLQYRANLFEKVVVAQELAEAWGQFGNPKETECLSQKAVTRGLVETQ
jgi:hypothetical protein